MKKTSKTNEVTRRLATLFVFAVVFFIGKNVKATEQPAVTISVAEQQTTEQVETPEQETQEVEQKIIMFGNGTVKGTLPNGTPITVTVNNGALEANFGTETYKFRNALKIVGSALIADNGLIHLYTFDKKYYVADPQIGVEIPVWRNQENWEYVVEHAANAKEVYVAFFINEQYFYETISGDSKSRERLVTREDFERIITPNKPEPSTEVSTTEVPTTQELTTEAPKTEELTTEVPTTEAPATETPTTEAPTTEAPKTEELTTEVPTTEAPATEAPTTEAPTTEAPATEVPATETPTTEVPSTEVPATETPTTEVPTTEVPATEVPTTEEATTEIPKTEEPTTEVSTSEQSKATEVKVVDGSVVKVQIETIVPVTTEKVISQTTEQVEKVTKNKTYYKVVTSKDSNIIKLVQHKGKKKKTACKLKFNPEKKYLKFHGIKYPNVKEIYFTLDSRQILLYKYNGKVTIVPRAKWKNGKSYTEKVLKGKWKKVITKNGFAIAISDGNKVKGVQNAQPKLVSKKKSK